MTPPTWTLDGQPYVPSSAPSTRVGCCGSGTVTPFYEEYPTARPTYVLNGFLFAIVGLHEFATATGDQQAGRMWREGEATAAAIITTYSLGKHDSTYDLATPHIVRGSGYAKIHVDLAKEMYRLTGRSVYAEMADRWAGALPRSFRFVLV